MRRSKLEAAATRQRIVIVAENEFRRRGMRLTSVILFTDIWLTWRTGRGLLAWRIPSGDAWLQAGGEIAVALLVFCVLMSFAVPAAALVFERLAMAFGNASEQGSVPDTSNGYVSVLGLRDYAHRQRDTMALQIVDAHESAAKSQQRHADQVGQLVLGLIALGLADSLMFLTNGAHSLVRTIVTSSTWTEVITAFLGWGSVSLLLSIWQASPERPAIHHWPAAEAVAKKQKATYGPFDMQPPPSAGNSGGLGTLRSPPVSRVVRDASKD